MVRLLHGQEVQVLSTGYFICDGSAISRFYIFLHCLPLLEQLHGSGNGSSTFNIPDLRDRFIFGASNSTGDTSYNSYENDGTGDYRRFIFNLNATLVIITQSYYYMVIESLI